MVFEVTLSSAHLLPVTVTYNTSNGTAIAPGDYQAATNQTITFNPGETTKTISINVVGDDVLESAETFSVTLSNPINADIDVGQAIGTILDDEVRSLIINDRVMVEGSAGTFTVILSSPASSPITVNFSTASGTATENVDFAPNSGVLTFASGEQAKTITVQTIPDDVPDDGETFTVTLSNAIGASIADGVGVGTISEVALAGLSGFVYNDINGNGQKTAGESGLAGVTIELIGVAALPGGGTQQIQTFTQTDATGRYIFENLPTGSTAFTKFSRRSSTTAWTLRVKAASSPPTTGCSSTLPREEPPPGSTLANGACGRSSWASGCSWRRTSPTGQL